MTVIAAGSQATILVKAGTSVTLTGSGTAMFAGAQRILHQLGSTPLTLSSGFVALNLSIVALGGPVTYTTKNSAGRFNTNQITAAYTFQPADDGQTFEVASALTMTFPVGLNWSQGIIVQIPAAGTITFASDGTTLLNGATSSQTRTITNQRLVQVVPRFAQDSYDVTGS